MHSFLQNDCFVLCATHIINSSDNVFDKVANLNTVNERFPVNWDEMSESSRNSLVSSVQCSIDEPVIHLFLKEFKMPYDFEASKISACSLEFVKVYFEILSEWNYFANGIRNGPLVLKKCMKSFRFDLFEFFVSRCTFLQKDIDHAFVKSCRYGQLRYAKFLLDYLIKRNVNIPRCRKYFSTALMHAAQTNQVETVEWLLSLGADPFLRGCENKTALEFALGKHKDHVKARFATIKLLENAVNNRKEKQIDKLMKDIVLHEKLSDKAKLDILSMFVVDE